MSDDIGILAFEPQIRLSVFLGIFAVMALWEVLAPRRGFEHGRMRRWPGNIGIVVVNTVVVRLLFPTAAVGMAITAADGGYGLLNQFDMPFWLATVISVVVLDFAIYLQHVLFHAVPAFWRLHRMHHADLGFDVTTGARFHPIEIVLSMIIKFMVVAALGPTAVGVLIFEVLLNGSAMFNHANVRLPLGLDRLLRTVIVTPDMHRVHHSILPHETNSNFGFNLSVWDRLFGTYRAQPEAGHESMAIGIEQFRDGGDLRLDRMLVQPLKEEGGRYPFGGR